MLILVMLNAFERIAAASALLACAPLLALAGLAIVWEDGFPIFFRQERVGINGRPFRLVKLRSMRNRVRGTLITAGGDTRITRVGAVLRKYKLDELPQFWNILMGHMRFVGPRPELSSFIDPHDPLWQAVLASKPGLTDPATLAYRNEEEVLARYVDPELAYRQEILPRKLALSVEYDRQRTAWSDCKLVLLTIRRIFVETE